MTTRKLKKFRFASAQVLLATAMILTGATVSAAAQDGAPASFKPMFLAPPPHGEQGPHSPNAQITQWSATFTDKTGRKVPFTMVGTNPANTTTTTPISVYLIPIKMIYGKTNGNVTFDPNLDIGPNGVDVLDDLIDSPLFQPIDFNQGGTDLGSVQYIDAFQRGNFWYSVNKNGGGYHVFLLPFAGQAEQTIKVSASQGSVIANPSGPGNVGTMDYATFDKLLQGFIKKYPLVNPTALPLFITDNIYLTQNNGSSCCIGGYHSVVGKKPGGQTYAYATYVTDRPDFAQDVSAFSHELGEWLDDPFTSNYVNCTDNELMEVGDPLEGEANWGGYPYTLNGATYNLQSLVFIGYFGAKPGTSLHSWLSFQDDMNHVCPGQ